MRLFLDANILFSAAWREDSAARLLWDLASTNHCELLSSRLAVEEARRNTKRKRPSRSASLESLISSVSVGREPTKDHLTAAENHGLR